MHHVPEIKLIRTDTTLDLSQKAEKVWFFNGRFAVLYQGGVQDPLRGQIYFWEISASQKKIQVKNLRIY